MSKFVGRFSADVIIALMIVALMIVVIALVFGVAAFFAPYLPQSETLKFERLFMHSTTHFSVLVEKDGSLSLRDFHSYKISFKRDVQAGESPWVEIAYLPNQINRSAWAESIVFHLHAAKEINGAGWDQGKFGSGFTHSLE